MRKITAITLTALLFLNLFGYRIIFHLAEQASDAQLTATLDDYSFNEEELFTIKVPIENPYQLNQANFERVDGELKVDGKIYRYVKRRIFNGELILLCVPDHKKMQLEKKKNDYFENTNDISGNQPDKKTDRSKAGVFKNPVTEYEQHYEYAPHTEHAIVYSVISSGNIRLLNNVYLAMPGKPPRLV